MARNKYKVPTARFNLDRPIKGECLIMLKYFYRGLRLVYSTGIKIDPSIWDKDKSRIRTNTRLKSSIYQLNKELDKISQIVQDIYVEHDYGDIPRDTFRNELSYRLGHKERPKEIGKTLFDFIESYIEESKERSKKSEGTCKKYQTCLNHLRKYAADKKKPLDYENIDWNFRNDFEQWLYDNPRDLSQNTASKIFRTLALFMREAHRRRLHTNDVYLDAGFVVKGVKTQNKVRFSFNELEQLINHDFSNDARLERARDLFIVGCYTGLRFEDWKKVTRENIVTTEQGEQMVSFVTDKTSAPTYIPMLPELKAVLEKYDYDLRSISNQKFNDYIKEVVKIVLPEATFLNITSKGGEIEKGRLYKWEKVASHAARRSFATNFWTMGIPAPYIMQITTHSTEKQFFEYIDVNPEDIAKRFLDAVRKLKNNE